MYVVYTKWFDKFASVSQIGRNSLQKSLYFTESKLLKKVFTV